MKAAIFEKYGSPDELRLREVEKPAPGDDELLVKVHASSVNSWDLDILKGTPFVNRLLFGLLKPKTTILGCDIAGKVESVGRNAKQFHPGDEVFGDISGCGWGGFAEYVCAREDVLAPKAACVTFEQAAAVPQAAVLALQGLRDKGKIRAGQKVLINGAGGGSGTFAIQIAKAFGAEVTGVDHTGKQDTMRSTGADHVVDYTQEDFIERGERYDLILDVGGFRSLFEYKHALSPGGNYVMLGGSTPRILQVAIMGGWIARRERKRLGLLLHKPDTEDLLALNTLMESGKVTAVVDRCYPLDKAADALRYFGEGLARGKVVIAI